MEELLRRQDDRLESIAKAESNYKKSPKERVNSSYIESRLEALERLYEKFEEDHAIVASSTSNSMRETMEYFQGDYHSTFEEKYIMYKAKLKEDLKSHIKTTSMSKAQASESSVEVKLPQIKLPTFCGKYEEWQTFHDMFVSLIHENSTLAEVQKLHYLKSSLSGEPEILLRNLPITEANYSEAWNQLKRRYNNKRFNANEFLKTLFNQETIKYESASDIKHLLDTTSSCLKSLTNMGIDTTSWDVIIIHLVTSKLDSETRKMWEHRVGLQAEKSNDDLPTWPQLTEFLETRFRALEMMNQSAPNINRSQHMEKTQHSYQPTKPKSFHSAVQQNKCTMCSGSHNLYQCKQFNHLNPQERSSYVQEQRLCFNCLSPAHSVRGCHQATCCRRCGRRHHTLLHFERQGLTSDHQEPNIENEVKRATESLPASDSETRMVANFAREKLPEHQVLLATASVNVKSNNGSKHIIRALLDQGSMASFVTEATVQLLGLKRVPASGIVSGLGEGETRIKSMVSINLESRHNPEKTVQVNAFVLKSLTSLLPTTQLTEIAWLKGERIPLADPQYNAPGRINILLGAEVYGDIVLPGIIKKSDGPIAQNTMFGWILSGRVRDTKEGTKLVNMHIGVKEDTFLKQFWEMENEPDSVKKQLTREEELCEERFKSTTERDQNGRYVVRLPFKIEDPECQYGGSREIAQRRFCHLERKLISNPVLYDEYKRVINEYVELNHMAQIVKEEEINNPRAVYLPHHAVVRNDKKTTKVRVVFDASCQGYNKVSLNDELLIGPKLQQDLRHILLRWRRHRICLVADIVKMYRQVRVNDKDTDFQRIVWRSNPNEPIKHYRLLTVTFGTAAAPYLAVKSLQQLAKDEQTKWPLAADITLRDFYMDDLMTGCQTEDEAKDIYHQMDELMKAGGFELQKWTSNNDQVLKVIEEEKRTADQSIPVELSNLVKVLGISWNRMNDQFEYSVRLPEENQQPITKRRVLSDISRLYDPMGWIAPVVAVAKVFIQELWKSGLEWDEQLTEDLRNKWLQFRSELVTVKRCVIPRWLNTTNDCHIELHAFADASRTAYAAAVYMRVISPSGQIYVHLMTAKTKVSPVEKEISIPRLELCAAVLAAKLIFEVSEVMDVPQEKLYAWSDSTVVLAWLNGLPNRWTTFVSNRVSQILTLLEADRWRHVNTNSNPADCASRGLKPSEMSTHLLWWEGPEWLREDIPPATEKEFLTHEEERTVKVLAVAVEEESFVWTRFSTLAKMLTILAYCRRFLRIKKTKETRETIPKFVTAKEREEVLKISIKQTQEFHFREEIGKLRTEGKVAKKSSLYTLNPIMDKDGIIRVGGRIHLAQVTYEKRHPIILPAKSHLTTLIVVEAHKITLHGGPQVMHNYLRSRYWIIRGKDQVKKCYRECVTCLRYSRQSNNQLMGQLPEARLKPSKPFQASGVDYAGPINIKFSPGRGAKSYKGYIALFVCMVTRAIHLEAVSDLSTQGFIAAYRRFTARRGHCQDLYSDNGTNFVGADRQLKEMLTSAKSQLHQDIASLLTLEGTSWHFIPPGAPNFGGLWEAGVRSTKSHMKRVIGDSILTFEELTTVLTQIEACLNSRPLTKLSDNPDDPLPLTPGHFLVGEPLLNIPDEDATYTHVTGLQRWRLVQKIVNDFWKRWSDEYLVTLNQRHKWNNVLPEPQIDDVVIIKDNNLPPAKWLLGRIVEKHTGKDNITRVVTVKCKNSLVKRPCNKLCFLPKTT